MWGLVGKAFLAVIKNPIKSAAAGFLGYTFQDQIVEKAKGATTTVKEEVAKINQEGIEEYTREATQTASDLTQSAKEKLDIAADFTRKAVEDPTGVVKETALDALGLPSADFASAAGNKKDTGVMPALGKLMQGDFSGAAKAFAGDDGWGLGDMALAGGGGVASLGAMNWLWDKVSGGSDKSNNDDSGFSWGIALAVVAAVYIGFQYLGQDNENENKAGQQFAGNSAQENKSQINTSFATARDGKIATATPKENKVAYNNTNNGQSLDI